MSGTRPDQPPPPPDGAGSWRDFGVPDGGYPDPDRYTPAMDEHLPGSMTQPIETGPPPQTPGSGPEWWSSPSPATSGAAPEPALLPGGAQPEQTTAWPDQTVPFFPSPQPPQAPVGPISGAPAQTTGRSRWAALGVLAVVSALLGGGVVVGAERLADRGPSVGLALPAPGPGSTARPEGSIAKIAANALPSVVTIKIKAASGSGTGSGFVIDAQGHILTNNHVVAAAGTAGTITVELNNGSTLPAEVVGKDASYDLAVLKVTAKDLPALEFGRSTDVVVGDGVIAVGAPLGLDATVTSGIVSALNRPVTPGDGNEQSFINAIQTDAAINPGNSGGPLLDMNGRVIGVNSAIARVPGTTASSGGNIGVGFSIPSDQAAKTAQQLISTGKAEHPVLGVKVDRSYDGDGAKVAQDAGVEPGSAAEQAGLKDGDVITTFEGKKVTDADALIVAIRARSVGDTVHLKIQRGNQAVDVTMTLQTATG